MDNHIEPPANNLPSPGTSEYFAHIGRLGGQRILETRGRSHFSEIGRRGVEAQQARRKATQPQ